jgi:hypothetical protein
VVHLGLHNRDAAGRYSLGLGRIELVSHADVKGAEITVTCSIAGCECAGTLKSAGSLSRTVKGTASFIGPSMTAIFAPGGNAGTSVHRRRSDGVTNVCPSAACAGGIRKMQKVL